MPRSYQEIIRLVQNGDPVDSSLNTILRALAGNAEFLKQLLDDALLGQAVMAREVTVHEDVKVGQPVYFNANTQQLEQALAAATVDAESQELVTSDSTQVWGVCYYKHNSTKADILLYGYVELDVTEAISDTVAGMYFLSATSPGKLVRQVPPVTVPVLYWDGDSHVYVNPNFNNAFLTHQHYRFELRAVPAGDNVEVTFGAAHSIINADDDVEGWLPADNAVFDGKAPAGAKFGYNLSKSALNNQWPPLPLHGTTISWTRPVIAETVTRGVPAENLAYEVFHVVDGLDDGDSTTVVLSFTDSSGFDENDELFVIVDRSGLLVAGLTINSIEVTGTDEITISVTNNSGVHSDFDLQIAAYVFASVDRGVLLDGDFKEDTVPEELVVIDTNGIWWMSDCYGLVPWPADYGQTPEEVEVGPFLAVASTLGVLRTTPGSVISTAYGLNFDNVKDVAVNAATSEVYFCKGSAIYKTSLLSTTTTAYTVLASPDEIDIFGLDLDVENEVIYFTDNDGGAIRKVNFDGTEEEVLVSGLSSPKGIRIDATNHRLYFVDGDKIRRCDLDGTHLTNVVTGLNTPRYLALDVSGNKLYWTDSGTNKVTRSTLTGTSVTDLVTSVDAVGIDINVDESKLYYSIEGTPAVYQAGITGSGPSVMVTLETWQVPSGIRAAVVPDFGAASSCASSDMSVTCWFTKMQFQSASTVVTSLRAVTGSGLTVTCVQDDSAATTGDLQIDFDPDFLFDTEDDEPGHIVFKRHEDKTFYRGPVVESIIVDSDFILVSSTAEDGDEHQGKVTLSFTPTPVGSELPIEMVRLNNVEEEFYEEVLGLGFRQDVDAEYRAKVNIPSTIEATTVRIRLRFLMLARAAGDLPAFTLTARNVTRPGATTATALALPTTDSSVTLSTADATGMAEDDYVEVVSSEITTAPGDFVLFTLGRAGSSDSFAGDIHVIDQRAAISSIVA